MSAQDYLAGVTTGAAGAGALATLVATIIYAMPDDPLKPALHPEAQVTPDNLAQDIAKDPKLQQRWKLMREFVEKVDREVGQNLEQSAGGSQETATHWKDRVPSANAGKQADKASGRPAEEVEWNKRF